MPEENTYRFFLIVVAAVQTVISIRYVRRAEAGSTIFRHREEGILLTVGIGVFYLVYGAAFLIYCVNPAWMGWSGVGIPAWGRWLGVIPLFAGGGCLIWGLHHLGVNLAISISTKQQHVLIRSGPYRWVRHPLYIGGMVESAGVCLLMANWFVALGAGLFWAMIAMRTPMEEQVLINTFGDEYRSYMQSTGRFLPRLWP